MKTKKQSGSGRMKAKGLVHVGFWLTIEQAERLERAAKLQMRTRSNFAKLATVAAVEQLLDAQAGETQQPKGV